MSSDNNPKQTGTVPTTADSKGSTATSRRTVLQALGAAGLLTSTSTPVLADGTDATDSSESAFNPIEATIHDVRAAILSGKVTAEEIVQTYLDRIATYDKVLSSIINVNPNAKERARELDEIYSESGSVGPLHGVPIVLKDNMDTDDIPTTGGSLALEGSIPPDDAFIVEKLRDSGAIIIAKANLHEFAGGGVSISSLGGQVQNPYDLERISSGSSGGTGSAVAANLAVFGTGSDTGGSTRGPAMMTNLVGLRPTIGVISRDGIIPRALSRDTAGPIARTVTDTAIATDVMAGYDPQDPVTARSVGNLPNDDNSHRGDSFTDYLNEDGLEGARIGVFRDYFGITADEIDEDIETEEEAAEDAAKVTAVLDEAIGTMEDLGAEIVDPFSMGDFEIFQELHDAAARLDGEFKRGPNSYFETLEGPDTPDSMEEIYESGQYTCGIHGEITDAVEADISNLDEELEVVEGARQTFRDHILEHMAAEEVEVVLYPTGARPPTKIGEPTTGWRRGMSPRANMPSISVPAGFTEDKHLPVALELMARPFEDPRLIELAYAFEQGTDHREPPEGFGPLPNEPPENPIPNYSVPIGAEGCQTTSD